MNPTHCPPELELYVLDAISTHERAAIELHTMSCAACREELARLQSLAGQLRGGVGADDAPIPARLRRRLQQELWVARMRAPLAACSATWLRVAALLVAALGLGYAGVSAWVSGHETVRGDRLWTQAGICSYPVASGSYPVVSDRMVIAVAQKADGRQVLLAMDRTNGRHVWESPFAVSGAPLSDGNRLYVWRADGPECFHLAALDCVSGRELWASTGAVTACHHPWPLITAGRGVCWSDDRRVALLDGATGMARWSCAITDEGALSVPVADDRGVYVASSKAVHAR